MKSLSASVAVLAVILVACGGGPAATPQPGGQQTLAPGQPTQAPAPPPAGGESVSVTLTGGPDAGTYTGTDNPNCSLGIIGPNGWGTQYSVADGPDNALSSLQLVSAAPGMADDEEAFFQGTEFLITVTIGTLFADSSRDYEVAKYTENADKDSTGTGSATVADTGSTAVIHATGTTADGVGIDATVNCPSVIRQ